MSIRLSSLSLSRKLNYIYNEAYFQPIRFYKNFMTVRPLPNYERLNGAFPVMVA